MYYKLKLNVKTNIYVKTKKKKQIYKINFRYTQVLFMGSVPRINYPLANVFLDIILRNKLLVHTFLLKKESLLW